MLFQIILLLSCHHQKLFLVSRKSHQNRSFTKIFNSISWLRRQISWKSQQNQISKCKKCWKHLVKCIDPVANWLCICVWLARCQNCLSLREFALADTESRVLLVKMNTMLLVHKSFLSIETNNSVQIYSYPNHDRIRVAFVCVRWYDHAMPTAMDHHWCLLI